MAAAYPRRGTGSHRFSHDGNGYGAAMSNDDQLDEAPGPAAKDQPAEGGRDIDVDPAGAEDSKAGPTDRSNVGRDPA